MTHSIMKVQGLDRFGNYFAPFKSEYVIIGDLAMIYWMEEKGLRTRATKDIDMVVYCNPNRSLANYLSRFIGLAKYGQVTASERERARMYRFSKPSNNSYPAQIEIFSVKPFSLELRSAQRIVPFQTDEHYVDLSAILIDERSVDFATNHTILYGNIPLLDILGLLCFKIKAYLDLRNRKLAGERIDSKDIKKHRNDIFVLSLIWDGSSFTHSIPETFRKAARDFVSCVSASKSAIYRERFCSAKFP